MSEQIVKMLDVLSELKAQYDAMMLAKKELIDGIMTPEIREAINDIEVEFSSKSETVCENMSYLETSIKDAVKDSGESVKATHLHAVFSKGRVSWDAKGLDGYATGHPEILHMRKEGEPSVSIRAAK